MRDKRKIAAGAHAADAITNAAARWLARRDRGLSRLENAELERWIAADPRHAAELARLDRAWRKFDGAGAIPELAAMAQELEQAPRFSSLRRRHAWRGVLTASAAAIALLAGVAWWRVDGEGERARENQATYHVLASAARSVALDDGSMAEVRDDGELQVQFSTTERRVTLIRGEAHFTVAKDSNRPFLVTAGTTTVRAVGTAFNVRLESARLEVLVTEGEVEVSGSTPIGYSVDQPARPVVAGQRAVIERVVENTTPAASAVEIVPATPAEVEQTLAWQSTRLVFDRTPLADAVDAFNQHAPPSGVKLVIGDPALRARRLGGTFRTTNVEGFVRLLERGGEVRAEQNGSEIVLLSAH